MNKNEIINELEDWIEEYESVAETCKQNKTIAEHSGTRDDVLMYETQMYDYNEIANDLKHFLIKAIG